MVAQPVRQRRRQLLGNPQQRRPQLLSNPRPLLPGLAQRAVQAAEQDKGRRVEAGAAQASREDRTALTGSTAGTLPPPLHIPTTLPAGTPPKFLVLAGPLQREQQHQQLLQLPHGRLPRSSKAAPRGAAFAAAFAADRQGRRPVRCLEPLLDGRAEQRAQALLRALHPRQQASSVLLQLGHRHLALL